MGRGDLSDEQWQRLAPLLSAQKPPTGRPGKDHRAIINGILWVLRTGVPCRNAAARGAPRPTGFTAGGSRACGKESWLKRRGAGCPRSRPERVCGDKGYSSGKIRAYLRRRGVRLTIPRKRNERRRGPFDREIYRRRNVVERSINRLRQFRRIAARYEKKVKNCLAMLQIAAILLWI